ncbi:hypothetical protein J0871_14885 [Salegentibacter sp. BDJ18]|uniref:hypothetical protein n=1 Tax=Salegentibacter sp. BDJ18 TaxID=2816376 RepID=UPI001AAE8338|nr:hypothetical protein [Salegentibacter sp. BDJ18]MBO2545706.1 hypothetical protein [Salegentibacter sp. BDJ18]
MKREDLKYEYIKKRIIQEQQFFQWLQVLFRLNIEINQGYNHNSADLFVVKLYQLLTEGKTYCEDVISRLPSSEIEKIHFFEHILKFIGQFETDISIAELDFLEYKRHNICHIFQNGYEQVQADLRIKKHLKNRELSEIDKNLNSIIGSEENEFEVQKKLFKKYYSLIEKLRTDLISIQKQGNGEKNYG